MPWLVDSETFDVVECEKRGGRYWTRSGFVVSVAQANVHDTREAAIAQAVGYAWQSIYAGQKARQALTKLEAEQRVASPPQAAADGDDEFRPGVRKCPDCGSDALTDEDSDIRCLDCAAVFGETNLPLEPAGSRNAGPAHHGDRG